LDEGYFQCFNGDRDVEFIRRLQECTNIEDLKIVIKPYIIHKDYLYRWVTSKNIIHINFEECRKDDEERAK
jgi:hypothetical protein